MSTRITDLPQAETLNGSEVMPLVQNGVTKKATLDFINLASPAALILQQTQQVYGDTVDVKTATDAVLVEAQSVLADTQVVLGQTIGVKNDTIALKLDFETQYLGPHPSAPTLNNEGDPLEVGALYWDTTLMAMFVWDGATWTAFSSAVASVNGFIGEVILGFADVGAAGLGANTNITSLGGLTGDVATTTGVQFDTAAPSAAGVGKLTWNTTDQTLDLGLSAGGVSMQIGQEVYYRVKNGTAGVIPNGSMVRYTGTEGLSGNILVAPALANGGTASQTFLGLTTEALNPGDSGFATHFGRVRGIDTTGNPYGEVWADGDVIFASALVAGWLTKNPPEAPNNRVRVGIVVHAHPNGVLFVNPTYGGKLSENEQVQLAALADGDVLQYDASQSRFENRTLAGAGIEPSGSAASSMAAHLASPDPHPQYTTAAEASAAAPVQSVAGKTGAVSLTNADVGLGNVANVLQAAAARMLTAGNGLTGGGDLSADRSFVLGTPSTLTTVTTNAVTATSHTHAVTFPVTSVAGKTGAVALAKADVGLSNVDNTSDANKPVSTATQAALNQKMALPTGFLSITSADLNAMRTPGFTGIYEPSCTNLPVGGTGYWYVLVLQYSDTNNVSQIAFPYGAASNSGKIAYRTYYTDTSWEPWKYLSVEGHTHAISDVSGLQAALNLKFDLAGGTVTGNTNIVVNSASEALRITQTGAGLALRVEDSANPDSTPFVVDANGNVGVKTAAPAVSFAVNASDAILVPIGSTANRPAGATGYLRFNTELTQFEGYNGTAWGTIGGGATGAAGNYVFNLNDQNVTGSYSIPSGKNAMTAGPIQINDGVTVTVPDGSTWTVV